MHVRPRCRSPSAPTRSIATSIRATTSGGASRRASSRSCCAISRRTRRCTTAANEAGRDLDAARTARVPGPSRAWASRFAWRSARSAHRARRTRRNGAREPALHGPHWYLAILGTSPAAQRRGIGVEPAGSDPRRAATRAGSPPVSRPPPSLEPAVLPGAWLRGRGTADVTGRSAALGAATAPRRLRSRAGVT